MEEMETRRESWADIAALTSSFWDDDDDDGSDDSPQNWGL